MYIFFVSSLVDRLGLRKIHSKMFCDKSYCDLFQHSNNATLIFTILYSVSKWLLIFWSTQSNNQDRGLKFDRAEKNKTETRSFPSVSISADKQKSQLIECQVFVFHKMVKFFCYIFIKIYFQSPHRYEKGNKNHFVYRSLLTCQSFLSVRRAMGHGLSSQHDFQFMY